MANIFEGIKAVIFDMDGVLVDSQPLHFDADTEVLKKLGVTGANRATVTPYAGMSGADRWSKYRRDFDLAPPAAEIIETHTKVIGEMLKTRELRAIGGVRELLDGLKERGIALSVASSSSYEFVYAMLDKISLRAYFEIIISGEDMKNSKPAPDIFLAALERHGVPKESALIVEDSANGVKAAAAAGISCIGYKNQSSGDQDLSGAKITIENFSELTKMLN